MIFSKNSHQQSLLGLFPDDNHTSLTDKTKPCNTVQTYSGIQEQKTNTLGRYADHAEYIKHLMFCINFFTAIECGFLTDEMRNRLSAARLKQQLLQQQKDRATQDDDKLSNRATQQEQANEQSNGFSKQKNSSDDQDNSQPIESPWLTKR